MAKIETDDNQVNKKCEKNPFFKGNNKIVKKSTENTNS